MKKKYIVLAVLVFICYGFSFPGCATVDGGIDVSRDKEGRIKRVDFNCDGGTVDFEVDKDTVKVQTRQDVKPSFAEKVFKKSAEMAEEAIILEKSKDVRNPIQ